MVADQENMTSEWLKNETHQLNSSSLASSSRTGSAIPSNGFNTSMMYIVPPLLLGGVICNILIILVMRNKIYKTAPLRIYFNALAVADILSLLHFGIRQWLMSAFEIRLWRLSGYCYGYVLLKNLAPPYSAWLIFCIAIDRVLVVVFPMKAKQFSTILKAKIIVTTVLVVQVVFSITTWLLMDFPKCGLTIHEYQRLGRIILRLVIYHLVPFVGTCICYIILVMKVVSNRKKTEKMTGGDKSKTLLRTAMVICLVFLILTTPHDIYSMKTNLKLGFLSRDATLALGSAGTFLNMINYSINLFLNLGTSTLFRKAAKTLLRLNRSVVPTNS